jgi:hypothetical protein
MSIEVPVAEVHALALSLQASAGNAHQIGVRLAGDRTVDGDLQAAIDAFLEAQRMTGAALAGELRWLGETIHAVADSWLLLDGALVRPRGLLRSE